jgi:hypothetical protein
MLSAWGPSGAVSSVPVLARIWPEFSAEQVWGFIHGIGFGGLYLLLVGYGVAGLVSFRRRFLTPEGIRDRVFRLKWGFAILAALTWATVWTGTYLVYPEYRAMTKTSPRSVLLADEATATWHTFFMEFKEHSAFFAAFLATSVAIIAWYYGSDLVRNRRVRYLALGMHLLAFAFAGLAALFGAWITSVAPVGVPLGQGG